MFSRHHVPVTLLYALSSLVRRDYIFVLAAFFCLSVSNSGNEPATQRLPHRLSTIGDTQFGIDGLQVKFHSGF